MYISRSPAGDVLANNSSDRRGLDESPARLSHHAENISERIFREAPMAEPAASRAAPRVLCALGLVAVFALPGCATTLISLGADAA